MRHIRPYGYLTKQTKDETMPEKALLAAMAYVDLNPIRAGKSSQGYPQSQTSQGHPQYRYPLTSKSETPYIHRKTVIANYRHDTSALPTHPA